MLVPSTGHVLSVQMKKLLFSSIGMAFCLGAMAHHSPDKPDSVAYCLEAITQFAATDRSLIARSGDNVALREAATDSLLQSEASLTKLREHLAAIPDKNIQAMEAAAASARADGASFLSHYEVCWNYCSDQEVGGSPWQACIARCRNVDPVISRLDSCRALN